MEGRDLWFGSLPKSDTLVVTPNHDLLDFYHLTKIQQNNNEDFGGMIQGGYHFHIILNLSNSVHNIISFTGCKRRN